MSTMQLRDEIVALFPPLAAVPMDDWFIVADYSEHDDLDPSDFLTEEWSAGAHIPEYVVTMPEQNVVYVWRRIGTLPHGEDVVAVFAFHAALQVG